MRRHVASAIVLVLFCAKAAIGQTRGQPSRAAPNRASTKEEALSGENKMALPEVRLALSEFATCVVKRHPTQARAVALSTDWPFRKKFKNLADSNCLDPVLNRLEQIGGIGLVIPPEIFDYSITEAVLRADTHTFEQSAIDKAGPLQHPVLSTTGPVPKDLPREDSETPEHARQGFLAKLAFEQFGECVARTNPAGAYQLVKTTPGSPEESAAIKAIRPAMSGCIREGISFKANVTMVRGVVVTNLYRLLHAPRIAEAAAK